MQTWLFEISEYCNMHCEYCTADIHNKYVASTKIFDEFYKNQLIHSKEYELGIFGGEPFLQPDFIQYIIDKVHSDENCKSIDIPTNATIMNSKVTKILQYPKVKLSISHDGLNQKIRGDNKLHLEELTKFSNRSHNMLVGDCFTEDSNYLINNHLYLEKLGLNPGMTIVRDKGVFSFEQVKYFQQDYIKYILFLKKRISNDFYKSFDDLPHMIKAPLSFLFEFVERGIKKQDCSIGKTNNAITPYGEIIPCIRMTKDRNIQRAFEEKKHESYFEACNTCQIRNVCDRGCLVEHIRNDGLILELCEVYKIQFAELKHLLDNEHKVQKLYKGIK